MKWLPAQVYVYLIERVSQPTKKEKEGERERERECGQGNRWRKTERETERGRMRTTNKGREPKSGRNYDAKRAGKREPNGGRERGRGGGEDK